MVKVGLFLAAYSLVACSGAGVHSDADPEDEFRSDADRGNGGDVFSDVDDPAPDDVTDGEDTDWDSVSDADDIDPEIVPDDADEDTPVEDEPVCDPAVVPPIIDMGLLEMGEVRADLVIEQCTEHRLSFTAPLGSRVEIDITPRGMYPIKAAVTYPDAVDWSLFVSTVRTEVSGVSATMEVTPSRSGEYVVLLRGTTHDVVHQYDVALRCVEGCDLETTRYPILLVHGWTGFDSIGPLDYFYNIPATLRDRGYAVYVASLDPFNSVEVRSEQLAPQVDEVLASAKATKINIIAHSQGGLDSRRLISSLGYGDRVAALTTIATPHQGTPLLDVALGLLPGAGEEILFFLLEFLGATVVGSESDALASFETMTTVNVREYFNPANPDDPRVTYTSWTGRTCLFGITCDDICDIEIRLFYNIIYAVAGANDGIVPVSSAPWGNYRGELPADHFDEVGQLFGITNEYFDHEEFYLERARDFVEDGF